MKEFYGEDLARHADLSPVATGSTRLSSSQAELADGQFDERKRPLQQYGLPHGSHESCLRGWGGQTGAMDETSIRRRAGQSVRRTNSSDPPVSMASVYPPIG